MTAAQVAALPLEEAEATLTVELDRIQEISNQDPLLALDQMLPLLVGINIEVVKSLAPTLLENTNLRAVGFSKDGKIPEQGRGEARATTILHRTSEVITKLMASHVRVHDEVVRRGQLGAQNCAAPT